VESNNYVGIYLGKQHAVVVGVCVKGHDSRITGAFQTQVDPDSEDRTQLLVKQIAEGCAEHKLKADEAVVALDSSLYMQHAVHSEFQQVKQVAATVRFDTEEVLATDVSHLAVAFEVASQDDQGSQLHVFTAEHAVLEDFILALQSRGIDPIAVIPDLSCLARYIRNYADPLENGNVTLYGIFSQHHGYFLKAEAQKTQPVRTFIINAKAKRTELLGREIFTTLASIGVAENQGLAIYDSLQQVDAEQLSERLGLHAEQANWFQTSGTGPQAQADDANFVDYAIAMGAALMKGDRGHLTNFRDDFMPFQGRRLRMQGALRWASISVTILLLAVGTYLQICTLQEKAKRQRIWERVAEQYRVAMPGKTLSKNANPVSPLKREIVRLEQTQGGGAMGSGELASVPARLTVVLTAFNSVAGKTGLEIDKLDINEKTITVNGSTANSTSNLQFFTGVRNSGLKIIREVVDPDPATGRIKFTIILQPQKGKTT
jgi:hypothetical protein